MGALEEKIRQGCEDHPDLPDRQLAKLLGVGRTTVWKYRDKNGLHAKPPEVRPPAWIPPEYRLPPIVPPPPEPEEEELPQEQVDAPCAECGVMGRWGRLKICEGCMADFGFNENTWGEYLAWQKQIAMLKQERGAARIVPAALSEDLSVPPEREGAEDEP
jgi:hypothetical protein